MIQSEKMKYEKNSTISFFGLSFFSQKHIHVNSRQTSTKYIADRENRFNNSDLYADQGSTQEKF